MRRGRRAYICIGEIGRDLPFFLTTILEAT